MGRIGGTHRDVNVLVVEPDPGDVEPFIEAIEDATRTGEIRVVSNGDDALDFIHQRGEYTDVSRPDLILLDLHLPGTSGDEILDELKDQSELQPIPVLVLTDSTRAEDIARSYELHANAYVQKPAHPDGLDTLGRAIEQFWLTVAKLPPTE